MSSYDNNLVMHPEKADLTYIGSIHDPDADYSYSDLLVFVHEDGRVFYVSDAGCSCPIPFEGVESLNDMIEVTSENWDSFQDEIENFNLPWWWDDATFQANRQNPIWQELAADKTQLLAKVSELLPR